ncbi:MAG: family peptidase [Caulobacter sp.]|jgi:hypothetical protein|nr:family peptidase [Caulobacter sp.]
MRTLKALLAVTVVAAPGVALAQTAPVAAPAPFAMSPSDPPTAASEQVIGGTAVPNPAESWPATLKFLSGGGMCTSTVIGPRVILTAAHCIADGATGTVTTPGFTTTATCNHHPGYAVDYRLDVALCLTAAAVKLPGPNPAFETLNTDPWRPRPAGRVTLLGYGCRAVGGGGPSGVLYEGASTVVVGSAAEAYVETKGGAAVCFGDSGGGAYMVFNSAERVLFGVNSRGDIETRSLLSSVAHEPILAFIRKWRTDHAVTVCGLDQVAGCHG